MIGGNVDLDLLSLFPQKDARIIGGIERKGKLFKDQQWRRERKAMVEKLERREAKGRRRELFKLPSRIQPLGVETRTAGSTGGYGGTTARSNNRTKTLQN